jgi:hypothetical protein
MVRATATMHDTGRGAGMNTNARGMVEMPEPRSRWVMLHAFSILLAPACVDIQGGAAELSWSLRSFEGGPVADCVDAGITSVRLCWVGAGDGGEQAGSCDPDRQATFDCDAEHGATGFNLPDGPTAFWIEPICDDGDPATPGTFQVPAPIVRRIEEGKVVNLSSLAIVVGEDGSPTCGPTGECTCQR